jgi:hypothetical protein
MRFGIQKDRVVHLNSTSYVSRALPVIVMLWICTVFGGNALANQQQRQHTHSVSCVLPKSALASIAPLAVGQRQRHRRELPFTDARGNPLRVRHIYLPRIVRFRRRHIGFSANCAHAMRPRDIP